MPRSQTEKVSKFVDAITREANEQREEIARETKKYIEDQLAIAKDKALEDSYHLIQHRAEAVRAALHPLCVDMETAAIAHVCHANGIPFLAIRTITDLADTCGAEAFERNCRRAAQISAQLTAGIHIDRDLSAGTVFDQLFKFCHDLIVDRCFRYGHRRCPMVFFCNVRSLSGT